MAKHRRWADKKDQQTTQKEEPSQIIEEAPEIIEESPEIIDHEPIVKVPTNPKSILLSASKYVYIVIAAALLCGIFTPITLDYPIDTVILGMLTVFLGLGGGVIIFLGTKTQRFSSIMVCGGLGMFIVSLILIYEMAQRSIL